MKINLNGLIYTLATTTLLLASCNDELEENNNYIPIVEGDEICFGASDLATFGDGYSDNIPQSRTSYGEATWDGTKWHYPLNWVYGDEVAVYCKESPDSKKYTTYQIQWDGGSEGAVADGKENLAYLLRVGENGIHWGDVDSTHHFYAFYPASAIQNDFVGGVVKGTIPNAQEVSWSQDNDGNWVGKPNMNYAFMRAYNEVKPTEVKDGKVALTFEPLTTAIDVILTAKTDVTISAVQVSSRSKDGLTQQSVCGDFEYNIGTGHTTVGDPDVATDYRVTVSCWHDDGSGNQVPIELRGGQSLKFTVFLLPGSDAEGSDAEGSDAEKRTLHNLEIRVPGWNNGLRAKYYDGIDIKVGTKSQIYLPGYEPNDSPNNWISSLPDNVYISQLSIPGSVNAFSSDIIKDYNYPGEGQSEMDLTQNLSVEDQFKIGVRAFEIATERYIPFLEIGGMDKDLGKDGSLIAGTKTALNLNTALSRLARLLLNSPKEFVIVMPYYAPDGTAKNEMWSNQLKICLQNLGGKIEIDGQSVPIKPFKNSMTIEEARGSILFLSRMPGDMESVTNWVGKPQYTTAIYGWDSDKDRWVKRGYGKVWDGDGDPKGDYTYPGYTTWRYDAAIGNDDANANVNFYIQDWLRVCKENGSYAHQQITQSPTNWYESITEKKENVKDFMNQTIANLKNTKDVNNVFINSLSGYYIVSKWNGTSGQPIGTDILPDAGKHGDIPPFARDINNEIYNYVLDLNYQSRGPLGIILINYAGASEYSEIKMHGDYIVKALVDNNFLFPLIGQTTKP